MQEVDFASLTARETAPDPTSSECGADMELYMQDCRRLLALGIKRWGGDAPGRLGPRVLNPDDAHDSAMIELMFAPHPEADGTVVGSPPLQQAPVYIFQETLSPSPCQSENACDMVPTICSMIYDGSRIEDIPAPAKRKRHAPLRSPRRSRRLLVQARE